MHCFYANSLARRPAKEKNLLEILAKAKKSQIIVSFMNGFRNVMAHVISSMIIILICITRLKTLVHERELLLF